MIGVARKKAEGIKEQLTIQRSQMARETSV